jgi:hypothetical protein
MERQVADLALTPLAPDSIRAWEKEWRDRTALVQLEAGLREAIKHRGIDDRTAAGLALGAVLDFLYTQPHLTADSLHRPLYELLAALDDLGKGRVASMLEPPARFRNRPPDGALFRQAKGFALFAVEQLVERGDSARAACGKVALAWNKEAPAHLARRAETFRSWHHRSYQLPDDDPERLALAALRKAAARDERVQVFDILASLSRVLKTIARTMGE